MYKVYKAYADIAAKLNLSLKITGRRGDMHTLDMRLCSVDLFDTAEFTPRVGDDRDKKIYLSAVSGLEGFDKERFLSALRPAAERICAKLGVSGEFGIIKRIPLGAGMGGSSAVIAGVYRAAEACARAAGSLKNPIGSDFLSSLGSDVPYMCKGGFARVTGIGENVEKLPFEKLYFAVALPASGVDSKRAYAEFDRVTYPKTPKNEKANEINGGNLFKNDLEEAATTLNPEIESARRALIAAGARNVVLSGSGSAYSAVFLTERERDEVLEKLDYPRVLTLESIPSEMAQIVRLDKR